jgi:hypothetical protein
MLKEKPNMNSDVKPFVFGFVYALALAVLVLDLLVWRSL